MTKLSIRIDLASGKQLGPGKVEFLEPIQEHRSIAAAGRSMTMICRRALRIGGQYK